MTSPLNHQAGHQAPLHAVPLSAGNAGVGESDQASGDVAPTTEPGSLRAVSLFIDADNQSPRVVAPLFEALAGHLGARVVEITVAGNNLGKQVEQWYRQLSRDALAVVPRLLEVPARKEAADIALVLALGADLERHIVQHNLVIVVSRDELLIEAAEQASERGCRVLLAYADSSIPTASNAALSTLLLPVVNPVVKKAQAAVAPVKTTAAKPPDPVPSVDRDSVPSVLKALREMCTKQPGGGYTTTSVGQSLAKLGFNQKARKAFLKRVPKLATRGEGAGKLLIF